MKPIQILGAVVAAHAAVFMFIFAIPGCRSSGTPNSPDVSASTPMNTADPSPVQPAPTMTAGDLNPATSGGPSPVSYAPMSGGDTVRFSPTRPDSAAAASLQAPPVTGVKPASIYTVASGDSLWLIAHKNGLSVKELATANNIPPSGTLKVGQKLIIPSSAAPAGDATVAPAGGGAGTYTVVAGDSLALISKKTGATIADLRALNHLKGDLVRIGDVLTLPVGAVAGASTSASASPASVVTAPAGDTTTKYVVKSGETLGAIARRFQVKMGDLATANHITDPTKLRAGQELIIPGSRQPKPEAAKTPVPVAAPLGSPAEPTVAAPPPPEQDLDAGLKSGDSNVPVIKIEDASAPSIP